MIISGIGRLGREPKMQYNDKGNAITNLTVATDLGFGDNKMTLWLSLVAFGKQAEVLNQYLSKGKRLGFTAELSKVNTYDKQDGSSGINVDGRIIAFDFIDKADVEEEKELEF